MSFDFSTLITNRTYADVSRVQELASKIRSGTASEPELAEFNSAAMKGAYNYTDLNRVTAAMEALKAKLEGYGYAVPGYQRIKVPHVLPEPEPTNRLPEGYLELTYIESNGTQYIDTGFKPNNNTRVVMDVQATATGTYVYWGARTGTLSKTFCCFAFATSVRSDYGTTQKSISTSQTISRVIVEQNKNVCTYGGVSVSHDEQTFQCDYSLYLLAANSNGVAEYASMPAKVYSCQVYDNGTLVRDFVPCKNSGGVIGLYDIANDVFYRNAGSGAFAAGEEVVAPATASAMVVSDNVDEYDLYTWYEFDWPTPETMTIYMLNVSVLRSVFAVMKSTPSVPPDMVGLMAQEANDIEKILVDINDLLIKSTQAWFYSGELFAGEV